MESIVKGQLYTAELPFLEFDKVDSGLLAVFGGISEGASYEGQTFESYFKIIKPFYEKVLKRTDKLFVGISTTSEPFERAYEMEKDLKRIKEMLDVSLGGLPWSAIELCDKWLT